MKFKTPTDTKTGIALESTCNNVSITTVDNGGDVGLFHLWYKFTTILKSLVLIEILFNE